MVETMDFGLLFDADRQLLSIGYRDDDRTLDPTCDNLPASEARLASFVATAGGDVPPTGSRRAGRMTVVSERVTSSTTGARQLPPVHRPGGVPFDRAM